MKVQSEQNVHRSLSIHMLSINSHEYIHIGYSSLFDATEVESKFNMAIREQFLNQDSNLLVAEL